MKRGLIAGVGVRDIDNVQEDPVYKIWKRMLYRCYSKAYQKDKPTYTDCEVCEEWKLYSTFKKWVECQDWKGNHLDKDLLVTGNKVYSPSTCLFLPPHINNFLVEKMVGKGKYKTGVNWSKSSLSFLAYCSSPFTSKGSGRYVGSYPTEDLAHEAWRAKKEEYAKLLAADLSDPLAQKALISRFSVQAWYNKENFS